MRNWIIVAVALFALFVLGAVFAGGVGYMLLSTGRSVQAAPLVRQSPAPMPPRVPQRPTMPTAPPQATPPKVATRLPNRTVPQAAPAEQTRLPAKGPQSAFPLPPSKDASVVERWAGYYYSSTEPFEDAVAKGVFRVRFWFDVRRDALETFTADGKETAMGDSRIRGEFDRAQSKISFTKQYVDQGATWNYEGTWNSARRRIEGTYGNGAGGFVLYPRRLLGPEIQRFEQQAVELNNVDILGGPAGVPPMIIPPLVETPQPPAMQPPVIPPPAVPPGVRPPATPRPPQPTPKRPPTNRPQEDQF